MLKNYFKVAFRGLWKNWLYSCLTIAGLSIGVASALLTALWVFDELAYDTYNKHYATLGMLQKNRTYNGEINTETSQSIALGAKLRDSYAHLFDEVVVSSYGGERSLRFKETAIVKRGYFMENGGEKILDLEIVKGSGHFPLDPSSLLINESIAQSLFGNENPVDKIVSMDGKANLKIAGVYKNISRNSTFRNVAFYASFDAFPQLEPWVANARDSWEENSFPIYVKLKPNVTFEQASANIREVLKPVTADKSQPELFIHPMADWHFYPEFKNGVRVNATYKTFWAIALVGFIILLLASINFINLMTARSTTRLKEIGIRKAIGSDRLAIMKQIYVEIGLVVGAAALVGLLLVQLSLPWFNEVAEKQLSLDILSPAFAIGFCAFVGIVGFVAGMYPALYISSFHPIKVLKGVKITNQTEIFSRKSLVVVQFGISAFLLMATVVVYQQVKFGQQRPMGYDTNRLIQIQKKSAVMQGHFYAMRQALLTSGGVEEMAETNTPISENWHSNSGFDWKGKPPNVSEDFAVVNVTPEFGKAVSWKIREGRDFSRAYSLDTAAVIINKTLARLTGLKNPINETLRQGDKTYRIIGISEDIVFDSPYGTVKPTVYFMRLANMPFITLKLNSDLSISESIARVEQVLKEFDQDATLNIKFADAELESKFWREKRILNLILVFTLVAVSICSLGLFGLSTFMAEQRVKEIGIRKVLGASVSQLLLLLSKDFVKLVALSLCIATPIAWYAINQWLQDFTYRVTVSGWVFVLAGVLVLAIALLTVSYQAVKAALANPVKSLRSE